MNHKKHHNTPNPFATEAWWLVPLMSLPYSITALVLVDNLEIPWAQVALGRSILLPFFQSLSVLIQGAEALLFPLIFLQIALAAALFAGSRFRLRVAVLGGLVALFSSATVWSIYSTLTTYERFQGYPPFTAAAIGVAVYLILAIVAAIHRDRRGTRLQSFRSILGLLGLLGFSLATYLNYTQFKGYYPSLHLSLAGLSFVFAQTALLSLVSACWGWISAGRRWAFLFFPCLVFFIAITALEALSPLADSLIPYVATYTLFGESAASVNETIENRTRNGQYIEQPCEERTPPLEEASAARAFHHHTHFPPVPGFDLAKLNVLLITVEALRFDHTSLADASLNTTPNLMEMRKKGAFNFLRALSPASGTLQSISSLMTMTYPSFAPMKLTIPDWCGELLPEAETVGEVFNAAGYSTFHLIHTRPPTEKQCFAGFSQGFALTLYGRDFSAEKDGQFTMDEHMSKRAIEIMADSPGSSPFFGWIFFIAPHDPYRARTGAAATKQEAYRQEISYTDEQIGKILHALEQHQLDDKTVLIVTGDHGEAFGEHGSYHHNSSLYSEQYHVPLLVSLPQVTGRDITETTSTMYLFPWLLLHGSETMRAAALQKIRTDIAPVLLATDGSVLTELIATRGMGVSLYKGSYKINFHLNFGLTEFFDLKRDPGERFSLSEMKPSQMFPLQKFLDNYLKIRGCRSQYSLPGGVGPTLYLSKPSASR